MSSWILTQLPFYRDSCSSRGTSYFTYASSYLLCLK